MKKIFTLIASVMIALSANADPNVTVNNIPSTYNGWRNYAQVVLTDTLKTDEKVEITPDVNYDGKVDSQDVLKVYDYMKNSTEAPTESTREDVNHDGKVDSQDVLAIYDYMKTTPDTHEYVDLGLPSGTLWATCNVGASKPEEYGLCFAWGETTGYGSSTSDKHAFDYKSYKWCNGSSVKMTKYCISGSYGTVDNKTELEAADDAATVNWGSNWQMPSNDQITELYNSNYTTIIWTTENGIYGAKVISNTNNNSIFLPAAGYRYNTTLSDARSYICYWSRSLCSDCSTFAYSLSLSSNGVVWYYDDRCDGQSVRPVRVIKKNAPETHEYVEIGGLKWATMNLGATTVAGDPSTCYGDYYAWGETEPRYTSITISGDGTYATIGGWKSSHSSGYSKSDFPSYTGETLDAAHDAATQTWGSDWRTPSNADFQALANACTGSTSYQTPSTLSSSSPTGGIYWLPSNQTYLPEYKGVAGILFVDKTDTSKRVFFPAAGSLGEVEGSFAYLGGSYCSYWSSSLNTSHTNIAFILHFDSSHVGSSVCSDRYFGLQVRPVRVQ